MIYASYLQSPCHFSKCKKSCFEDAFKKRERLESCNTVHLHSFSLSLSLILLIFSVFFQWTFATNVTAIKTCGKPKLFGLIQFFNVESHKTVLPTNLRAYLGVYCKNAIRCRWMIYPHWPGNKIHGIFDPETPNIPWKVIAEPFEDEGKTGPSTLKTIFSMTSQR